MYSLDGPGCAPTCSDPNPSCSGTTRGCICPNGTVLDEVQNKCVPLSKCSKNIILITNHNIFIINSITECPQQCTHEFCTSQLVRDSRRPVPCMR